MITVTNTVSLSAQNSLSKLQKKETSSLEQLSSGLRINSAKDDAAGLQISSRLTSKIYGSGQAIKNTLNGISVTQSIDGALESVVENLQRMRSLTIAAGNGANASIDIDAIYEEFSALRNEIDRVANDTTFAGTALLNGTYLEDFQVGQDALQTIRVTDLNTKTENLGSYEWEPKPSKVLSRYPDGGLKSYLRGVNLETAFNDGPLQINGQSFSGPYADIDDLINDINSAPQIPNQSLLRAERSGSLYLSGHVDVTQLPHVFQVNGVDVELNDIEPYDPDISYPPTDWRSRGEQGYYLAEILDRFRPVMLSQGMNYTASLGVDEGETTLGFTGNSEPLELRNLHPLFTDIDDGIYERLIRFESFGDKFTTMEAELDDNEAFNLYSEDRTKATIDSLTLDTEEERARTLRIIDVAIQQVSNQRNTIGATQNRFEATIRRQQASNTNLSAARQRIQETDFAFETAKLTQTQILKQASTSILSQANIRAESLLSLLDTI